FANKPQRQAQGALAHLVTARVGYVGDRHISCPRGGYAEVIDAYAQPSDESAASQSIDGTCVYNSQIDNQHSRSRSQLQPRLSRRRSEGGQPEGLQRIGNDRYIAVDWIGHQYRTGAHHWTPSPKTAAGRPWTPRSTVNSAPARASV